MSHPTDLPPTNLLADLGLPQEELGDPNDFARRLQQADDGLDAPMSEEESEALGRLWIALDKEIDEAWRRLEATLEKKT